MKIRSIAAVIILLVTVSLYSDTVKYRVSTYDRDENVKLQFSMEYFVNDIFLDFIVPFGLDAFYTDDDLAQAFADICTGLANGYSKMLTFQNETHDGLTLFFKSYQVADNISLVVMTNFDLDKKILVQPGGDFSACYSMQYFAVSNTLVAGHIFYTAEKEKEAERLKTEGDQNALADFYIFDGDSSNDAKIPVVIADGLKASTDPYHLSLLRLTQVQYYLFNKKYSDAADSLAAAGKLTDTITDPKQKVFMQTSVTQLKRVLNITNIILKGK